MWIRWAVVLGIRLFFAVRSTGYIHPDELFQSVNVLLASQTTHNHANITTIDPNIVFRHDLPWEFTSTKPIRSLTIIKASYALPNLLFSTPITNWFIRTFITPSFNSAWLYFWTLRIYMFTLSVILGDFGVHYLTRRLIVTCQPNSPLSESLISARVATAGWLFSTSYVTWVYLSRTLSNSFEVYAVLWTFIICLRINQLTSLPIHPYTTLKSIILAISLGGLTCYGIFNRATFSSFVLTPFVWLIVGCFRHLGSRRTLSYIVLPAGLSFSCLTWLILHLDVHAYQRLHTEIGVPLSPWYAYIAPVNMLIYNASRNNLVQHGLHPRYLHVLVNVIILLSPCLAVYTYALIARSVYQVWIRFRTRRLPYITPRACVAISLLVSLGGLSSIPHQEPRFLLALVPLFISFYATRNLSQSGRPCRITSSTLSCIWLTFNVLAATFYGFAHQSGILPSLARISTLSMDHTFSISNHATTLHLPRAHLNLPSIIYCKVYPPLAALTNVTFTHIITPASRDCTHLINQRAMYYTPSPVYLVCPDAFHFQLPNTIHATRIWRHPLHVTMDVESGPFPLGLSIWQIGVRSRTRKKAE